MEKLNTALGLAAAYTRRPVTVEAIQWQGWNADAMAVFLRDTARVTVTKHTDGSIDLRVPGLTRVSEGDWIVRDRAGILVVWTDYYFNYLYQGA